MTEVPVSEIKVHEKEKSYKGEFKYIMQCKELLMTLTIKQNKVEKELCSF